ncbi:hypothetical protein BH11BAC2_BH11BAC2_26570 [soil metagenome]
MKIKNLLFHIFYVFILVFSSCQGQEKRPAAKQQDVAQMKEDLINQNKKMIQVEMEQIDSYIDRNGLKMQTTETGLHYMIITEGKGPQPKIMTSVAINYRIQLLDGSYVYSSDSSGVLSLVVGQSSEPSGLQEGLLKLKEGSKALIIVPSYLAYGITGDGDRIGGSQSLIYQVELIKVNPN